MALSSFGDLVVKFLIFMAILHSIRLLYILFEKKMAKRFAKKRKYSHAKNDEFGLAELCKNFRVFSLGHSGKFKEQVYGEYNGFKFCFFRYSFSTSGNRRHYFAWHEENGLVFIPEFYLPGKLSVESVSSRSSVVVVSGGFTEQQPSDPAFTENFRVSASDPELAQRFLSPELIEYFVRLKESIDLDVSGNVFLLRIKNNFLSVRSFEQMLETADSILNLLDPSFVADNSSENLSPEEIQMRRSYNSLPS